MDSILKIVISYFLMGIIFSKHEDIWFKYRFGDKLHISEFAALYSKHCKVFSTVYLGIPDAFNVQNICIYKYEKITTAIMK